jgi:hypothetical protein
MAARNGSVLGWSVTAEREHSKTRLFLFSKFTVYHKDRLQIESVKCHRLNGFQKHLATLEA